MGTTIRREDRPGNIGETPLEKRSSELDNMVCGLKPCDEAAIAAVAEFAEADKGMHLVLIAANIFHERSNADDVSIRRCFKKMRILQQPPKHSVKQRQTDRARD